MRRFVCHGCQGFYSPRICNLQVSSINFQDKPFFHKKIAAATLCIAVLFCWSSSSPHFFLLLIKFEYILLRSVIKVKRLSTILSSSIIFLPDCLFPVFLLLLISIFEYTVSTQEEKIYCRYNPICMTRHLTHHISDV